MLVQPSANIAAKIKVVGVGGGGCNAINTMINDYKIEGVEFIAINTDIQVLNNSLAPIKIQIGTELTGGLGAGGNPEMGKQAAEESAEELQNALQDADMVFVTGGMGGGTGTGAIPVVSEIAKNAGALTVAIVTKPFKFEMRRRTELALEGISKLKNAADTMIVIPNQKLLEIIDKNLSFKDAMKKVDEVLANAVLSISSLITQTGFINLDFADVKSVFKDAGTAMMGIGRASGENRAVQAARQAITSPLLEMSIQGAKGVLFNIRGGNDLTMNEVSEAASLITDILDPNANVKFGAVLDEEIEDGTLHITVLAAGFPAEQKQKDDLLADNKPVGTHPQPTEETNTTSKTSFTPDFDDKKSSNDTDDFDIPAFIRRGK